MAGASLWHFFMVDVGACWWLMPLLESWVASKLWRFWLPCGFLSIVFISSVYLRCVQQFGSSTQRSQLLQVLGSSMEIGLCWNKKGTNNKWTYNLTDQLMLDLETNMTLISMIYVYKFKCLWVTSGGWKVFNPLY